jgi:hypothetical protein
MHDGTESDRKRKKKWSKKYKHDRAFMTGTIKEGNLQGKTHCDIEKMRAKEEKTCVSR